MTLYSFPGYDDEPRTAENALQEWIDTQELDLTEEATEALYQFTHHAASAEDNIRAIRQGAEYAGIDLSASPLPTPIPEPIIVLDTDARADAWLFRSQIDAMHSVVKDAGYDTPYLATRRASDVREVNEAFHAANDAPDASDLWEEAREVAEARLGYWETFVLQPAGFVTEYIPENAAWIIRADAE